MEKYRAVDALRGRVNLYKGDLEIGHQDLVDEANRLRGALVGVQVLLEVGSIKGAIDFIYGELEK